MVSGSAGDGDTDPGPAFNTRILPASYGVRSSVDSLRLEVTSRLGVEAEVIVEAMAIDETQATKVLLSVGTVAPESAVVLDVPIAHLPAPDRPLRVAGVLSLFTRLRPPAGGPAIPDADGPKLVSYHPEAQGVRFYDEETRRRDYHGGALDPVLAASLAPGEVLAASYSGPTMPLDSLPTFPEESERDPDHVVTEGGR